MTQLSIRQVWNYEPPNSTPRARAKTAARVARLTIAQRFGAFAAANPHVLQEMLRLARARLDRGETRIGAKALWEELRQSIRVNKLGNWKLDNSLTAMFARALIEADQRLGTVIETRRRKAL